MTRRSTLLAVALMACPGTAPLAEQPPSATALLQRAIEVHGGETALAEFPDLQMTGTMESMGRMAGRRSDAVIRERGDGAYRYEVTFEFRGRRITVIELYDLETRKRRVFRGWDDLPVIESRERAAHRLPFLLAVDPSTARVTGEGTEADEPVWRVSIPGGRDETVLSLSKDDGRLVAIEFPGTSAEGMGTTEEVRQKQVYRDHRRVGDLLLPFDVEYSKDGSPSSRWRYETIELLDAFDPVWLRVPDPTRRFIPSEELVF